MKAQGRRHALIGFVFTFVLAVVTAGCGGGDGGAPSGNPPSTGLPTSNLSVHADAGDIVAVRVNQKVTLDGSASSTTSTEPLTFAWFFTSKPYASKAKLQKTTSANPDFIADVAGTYMVQLVVSAGSISSKRAIAFVEVTIEGDLTGMRDHTRYPSTCDNCHDGRYAKGVGPIDPIPPKSGNHLATSNMCQACHTTFGFNLIRSVDHLEVYGNCSACHNGVLAIGKSEFHVSTSGECNDCHNTSSFLKLDANGNYDHTDITSGCASCHNGKIAIGINHITDTSAKSNNDCSFCHTTTSFKDAFPDHSTFKAEGPRCDSCHGVSAQGAIAGHPDMSVPNIDCGECHSVKQFSLGGVYNHRTVVSCETCHNDNNSINARGKASDPTPPHPVTTTDCGICHSVSSGDFAIASHDHTDDINNCAQSGCHDPASVEGKYAAGNTHVPTNGNDCELCHTPGNFATGVFDHTVVEADTNIRCDSCHDDTITAGKHTTHIPTPDDCRACHFSTTTFIGAVIDHSTITNNCSSCHDGKISKGKNINHLLTTRDCSVCHSTTTPLTFVGGTYDHGDPGISNNCASCHNGVIAIDKSIKANHIPAKTECSQCHNDTTIPDGFLTAGLFPNPGVHINYLNGCEGCHTAKYFPVRPLIKATGHVPTIQDCHSCHSNVNFADETKFTHANISGDCESCHNGNYIDPAGALGKVSDPTPPHPTTTADCGMCHGIGNNFTDGIYDHTGIVDNCSSCHGDAAPAPPTGAVTRKSSMTNPAHVTTTQDCSICHIPGTFKTAVFNHDNIVTNCGVSCHGGPAPIATIKPAVQFHVDTTEDCSACHNTTAFAGAKYDHSDIKDNCVSCHNGDIALGKDGTHVPTNIDCVVCHTTAGFKPATFDHTGVGNNCTSCHDGVFAQDKKVDHTVTSLECGSCHSVPTTIIIANGGTNDFIPATHSPVSINTRCDSCHGVTATGKDKKTNPDHWLTSLDCRSCHNTAGFLDGTWTHEPSSEGTCNTCHSAVGGAKKKAGGHMSTTSQCDECHTTDAWAPTNFSHDPTNINQDDYPGDHNESLSCDECHGNSIDNPFVYPLTSDKYAPFCAACHAGDFKRKGKHIGGENGTIEQNKNCSDGGKGCHKVDDRKF